MSRRAKKYSRVGELVSTALTDSSMTQTDLAQQLKRSTSQTNQIMTGHRNISSKWADFIADVLKMSIEQRQKLHIAAAMDAGYKIDLTPPERNRR